jgi:nucleoside-diphosphate-sugar epimerase
MKALLVAGAAGFIGSHLVDRLLAEGREVVGIDAFTGYYSRRRKERNLESAGRKDGFRLVEGDLLELDLDELVRGVDGIVHLAGEPGVRRSWGGALRRYLERNVVSTERLLEAAWRNGVLRFVYASSSSVYGSDPGHPVNEDHLRRPTSPYGLSKLAAEELIQLYGRERGVPSTILRYFTVYGPRQRPEMAVSRFIFSALRGRPVDVYGDGEQIRDMTYVADAVDATVAALDAPPGVYNVGGGTRATVNALLDAVSRVTGSPVEPRYGPAAEGDMRSTWADSRRAARSLDYLPRTGLEEGISAQVAWARESQVTTTA